MPRNPKNQISELVEVAHHLGLFDRLLIAWYMRAHLWLRSVRVALLWNFVNERRHPHSPVHWVGADRRRNRMSPTRRMMAAVTFGTVGVSVISWVLAPSIPQVLYIVPIYFLYVAILLVIKAVRLRRWVING